MQKVSFIYEIIVGEDGSTDGTREICIEYAEKYPDKIRLFLRNRKTSQYYENGRFVLRFNGLWNRMSARGKYIAICEGDDYWTDPMKLQMQVDFLQRHADYSICYHKVEELDDTNGIKVLESLNPGKMEKTYTIYDLAKKNIIHTPSVIYRRNDYPLPEWFFRCPVGDYPLHMLNARYGKIKYFPRPMAVYRRHYTSTWSSMGPIPRLEKWIKVLRYLIEEFDKEQDIKTILLEQLLNTYKEFHHVCLKAGKLIFLNTVTARLLQFSTEFTDLWYERFYLDQLKQLSTYPHGVKKSVRHLIKEICNKLK